MSREDGHRDCSSVHDWADQARDLGILNGAAGEALFQTSKKYDFTDHDTIKAAIEAAEMRDGCQVMIPYDGPDEYEIIQHAYITGLREGSPTLAGQAMQKRRAA